MNRRRFLAKVVAVAGGAAAVDALGKSLAAMDCTTTPLLGKQNLGHDALVCNNCAYYNKHIYCAICGKLACRDNESFEHARVCNKCDGKGDRCACCGQFVGKSKTKARICYHCAETDRKRWNCCKCGRSTGPELDYGLSYGLSNPKKLKSE